MEVIKSSRFWISIVIIVSLTVLAALKVISGEAATGGMMGLLGGFGVGKIPFRSPGPAADRRDEPGGEPPQ
jgi:hypothetical protein